MSITTEQDWNEIERIAMKPTTKEIARTRQLCRMGVTDLMREVERLEAQLEDAKKQDRAWREVVVVLIKKMPQPLRNRILASVATIPSIYGKLTPAEQQKTRDILSGV